MSVLDSERVRVLLERAGLAGLPPRGQAAVLVLAALVVVFCVWRFWPAAPAPEVSFAEAEGGADATGEAADAPPGDAPQTEDTAPSNVVVHVVGAVLHPGVYDLPTGSRVVDAVEAAGGALGTASLESLNLARILADGEQVYVFTTQEVADGAVAPVAPGGAAASGAASGVSAAGGLVDLNTATVAELDALPGIGPSTAEKIVNDRETNGPFASPEDLMRVSGIGAAKFEALKDLVTCG